MIAPAFTAVPANALEASNFVWRVSGHPKAAAAKMHRRCNPAFALLSGNLEPAFSLIRGGALRMSFPTATPGRLLAIGVCTMPPGAALPEEPAAGAESAGGSRRIGARPGAQRHTSYEPT